MALAPTTSTAAAMSRSAAGCEATADMAASISALLRARSTSATAAATVSRRHVEHGWDGFERAGRG